MFMDKVKNFCDHSMILWEMAGDLLTSGSFWPPPLHRLGLNQHFKLKNQRNWLKQVGMLKFWSVINCIFVHWTKKLTLHRTSSKMRNFFLILPHRFSQNWMNECKFKLDETRKDFRKETMKYAEAHQEGLLYHFYFSAFFSFTMGLTNFWSRTVFNE